MATLIINRGTIEPGQILVAGNTWCKVRMLTNEHGKSIKSAGPSSPVEVAGWKEVPAAGDSVLQAKDEVRVLLLLFSQILIFCFFRIWLKMS